MDRPRAKLTLHLKSLQRVFSSNKWKRHYRFWPLLVIVVLRISLLPQRIQSFIFTFSTLPQLSHETEVFAYSATQRKASATATRKCMSQSITTTNITGYNCGLFQRAFHRCIHKILFCPSKQRHIGNERSKGHRVFLSVGQFYFEGRIGANPGIRNGCVVIVFYATWGNS